MDPSATARDRDPAICGSDTGIVLWWFRSRPGRVGVCRPPWSPPMSRRVLPLLLALSVAPCSALNLNRSRHAQAARLDGAARGAGLRFVVADFESKIELRDEPVTVPKPDQARVPDSRVEAERSTRTKTAMPSLCAGNKPGTPLCAWSPPTPRGTADLRPFLNGTLGSTSRSPETSKGGFSVAIGCGTDCYRRSTTMLPSRALQGQGWQHLAFSMRCFARQGQLQPRHPALCAGGRRHGRVAVANIRFRRDGKGTVPAPTAHRRRHPSPLNQVWSLDWWMPRHEAKLAEVRDRQAKGENRPRLHRRLHHRGLGEGRQQGLGRGFVPRGGGPGLWRRQDRRTCCGAFSMARVDGLAQDRGPAHRHQQHRRPPGQARARPPASAPSSRSCASACRAPASWF